MKIDLAFQKIMDTVTGRPVAYEVLARGIESGTGRVLTPGAFAGAAGTRWEDIDLCILSGLSHKRVQIPRGVGISINVAPETIVRERYWRRFIEWIEYLAQAHDADVIVEVSERMNVPESEVATLIDALHNAGALAALDDYGTASSSDERLKAHQWDICKIDYRPVMRPEKDRIAQAVVEYCDRRGIKTVLEGLETAADLQLVDRIAANWNQGFAYGLPFLSKPAYEGEQHVEISAWGMAPC